MERVLSQIQLLEYEAYLNEKGYSQAVIEEYMRGIRKLYIFLPKGKKLDEQVLRRFKRYLKVNYTVRSTENILLSVNTFLVFAEKGEVAADEVEEETTYSYRSNGIEKEDYVCLLNAARDGGDQTMYLIIQTICFTGIRISHHRHITAEAVRLGKAEIPCKKGMRSVAIPAKLRQNILQYCNNNEIKSGPVFNLSGPEQCNIKQIWNRINNFARKAELPQTKIYIHNFHHLFARLVFQRERELKQTPDLFTHAAETTRIYPICANRIKPAARFYYTVEAAPPKITAAVCKSDRLHT